MKISCPICKTQLPAAQMNVATDVAVCQNCDEVFSISEALGAGDGIDENFDLNQPPSGAWFEDTGSGWRAGATTRSGAAFFLVPFTCVWSGGSVGLIYGSQIAKGEFDLLPSLFGIPFFIGSIFLCSAAAMTILGKVVVSVEFDEGRVFTGVGPMGWTRRFDWRSITSVVEDYADHQQSGSDNIVIALVGQSRLKFGSMLSYARRDYLLQVLRKQLANRKREASKNA